MTETTEPGGGDPAPDAPDMPIVAQRALAAPATVDRAARTVEVVWSTGARARNFVPALGLITEELEMSPNAVRMDALRSGQAPVLNTHRRGDARDVLGRVTAARIERGRGYATLQFSAAADVEPVWQRIADGTLRAVSVGYRVHRYEPRPDAATGETVHRAVDWEPFEISVVPVPVDRDAAVRAQGEQGLSAPAIEPALPDEEPIMPETTPETPAAPPAAPPSAAPSTTPPQERLVTTTPSAPTPEPIRAAPDLDAVRAEAQRAERERIAGIDAAIEAARALVPADRIPPIRNEAVERGWSADQVRRALFDLLVTTAPKPSVPARPESGPGHDDPAMLIDAMAEALAARSMPGYQPQGNGRHAEFMGWRPSDMIGELLRARGERSVPRNPTLLAERAFHTTSDFPALLSAAANKMLLAAYAPAHPTMKPVALVERAIRNSSKQRDTVLDPFGGSGTTMIAAERTGRRAVLLEIDLAYADVIVRRWQETTGGTAVLDGEDRTFDDIAAARGVIEKVQSSQQDNAAFRLARAGHSANGPSRAEHRAPDGDDDDRPRSPRRPKPAGEPGGLPGEEVGVR